MREVNQMEFDEAVKEGFTLVDVYGETCQPCVILSRFLEVLEKEYPFVNIVKINANQNEEFSQKYDIMGVPTILFMQDGELKHKHVGLMSVDEIMETASEYLY